jgi:LysR family transcriptional regulator (chromosome initiation inhibitor)
MHDYKLLEALAAVVREGGFERAARALCLTQSRSPAVRLLEGAPGACCSRGPARPRPTPDGRRLIRHCLQVRRLEEDLEAELDPAAPGGRPVLRIGVNADSLDFWFMDAVTDFVRERDALLDLAVDDQERTHRMLADGEVLGCVSARAEPMQGCTVRRLGVMRYGLLATPGFVRRHFPEGLTREAAARAPAVRFNRADDLHDLVLARLFPDDPPRDYPCFRARAGAFHGSGRGRAGRGMTPFIQAAAALAAGRLVCVDGRTEVPVALYWHRWNLRSPLLEGLSEALPGARGGCWSPSGPSQDGDPPCKRKTPAPFV